jgi:hypothetical protein
MRGGVQYQGPEYFLQPNASLPTRLRYGMLHDITCSAFEKVLGPVVD